MSRGRHTAITLTLTARERRHLEAVLRQTEAPAGVVRRARLLLLLAEGLTITEIARRVGIARKCLYKWLYRWLQEGWGGLEDRPKHGSGGARPGAGRPTHQQRGGGHG